MMHVIVHDGTGKITNVARSTHEQTLIAYLDDPNALFIETDELIDPNAWRIDPETKELTPIEPEQPAPPSLEAIKVMLQARLDLEAETSRQRYITPGSGQAMEYGATEAEAKRFVTEGIGGGPYPMLEADLEARRDNGESATLAGVASDVLAMAELWYEVAVQIKRLRRTAKLAVENASTTQQAYAAAQVNWP